MSRYEFAPQTPRYRGSKLSDSGGGPPFEGRIRDSRNVSQIDRGFAPGDTNDKLVNKSRGPWYHRPYYIPPPIPVNWTQAGPVRNELHMRTYTYRKESGESFQYREGMHTMVPRQNAQKQIGKERMTSARQNRLTVQRYRGQSYSNTTKVQ